MTLDLPPACLAELAAERELYNRSQDETSAAAARFKGQFVLIKDDQYNTALPTKLPDGTPIPFAKMVWDAEAKRKTDHTWDIDRVIRSTRFECPHCGSNIVDKHRTQLDKHGLWIPTRSGEPGHYGYQLSSFYAPIILNSYSQVEFDSTWGGMASKFLTAIEKGTIGGWINSELAEVNTQQQSSTGAVELSSRPMAQPDWVAILTADFHKNAPYIWFIVRKWCAFKLLPPVTIVNGLPEFVHLLDLPGNEAGRAECAALIGAPDEKILTAEKYLPAWNAVAELFRFKSGDDARSAINEFLIAQKITGEKLVKLYREDAGGNTMDFRKVIYQEMARHEGHTGTVRPARGGDSELIAAGNLETSGQRLWDDVRDLETEFKVGAGLTLDKRCTFIDSGYQEEFEAEVLRQCYERAEYFKWYDPQSQKSAPTFHGLWKKGETYAPKKHAFCQVCPVDGWLPLRGIPTNRPQGDGKISRDLSLRVADPFYGTPDAGTRVIEVLNIPQGLYWFRRQDLLQKRTKNIYGISPAVSFFPKNYDSGGERSDASRFRLEDYQKQLNVQFYNETTKKVEPRGGRGGSQNKRYPYHLDDCETYQIAAAEYLELFDKSSSPIAVPRPGAANQT